MEKKVLGLLLSVTTPCMRCGNHFDTISWQCVVCAGRTYHHAASRLMSPRSIVITLTCLNLWQWVVRISANLYLGLREAGNGNDVSLDSHQPHYRTPSYSLHHMQVICRRDSSHYSIMLAIHITKEVKVARENLLKCRREITQSEAIRTIKS